MSALRIARARLLHLALAACLFLIVVGAQWAIFDRYGSPMPDWDQWDAEAMELLVPWFEHDHFVEHLFHPHNEHRILLTKLQNLGLVLLNGQWDSRLEATTNALLHAALAVGFWLLARRIAARRWHAPLFALIAAMFALPLAWQNVLGGFHSQQYWLLDLSFVAIVLLLFPEMGGTRWWLGLGSAILALGTMGSGFIAAAVVAFVLGLRAWRRDASWRKVGVTLALMAAIVAFGLITRVSYEGHAPLKASGVSDFVWSTIRSLEWPMREVSIGAAVMWLPFVLLSWQVIVRGAEPRGGWTLFALGSWVLVQILATSYARGIGGDYPASRYMDTLVVGALVNALALAWLAAQPGFAQHGRALGSLAALWLLGLGVGGYFNLAEAFGWDLPQAKRYYLRAETALHRYLLTHDPGEFAGVDLPYPNADDLMARLDHPVLNALLPVPIRTSLPLQSAQPEELRHDAAFLPNELPEWNDIVPLQHGLSFDTPALDSARTWGSFGLGGTAMQGEWRSAPLPAPQARWLKFETAGNIGEPGVALELRDARTDALLSTVRPTRVPHDSWRAAYVHAPKVPFIVVARDRDATRWIAFSPPMEMGAYSYSAWQAAKNGLLLLWSSLGAAVVLGVATVLVERGNPHARG